MLENIFLTVNNWLIGGTVVCRLGGLFLGYDQRGLQPL